MYFFACRRMEMEAKRKADEEKRKKQEAADRKAAVSRIINYY